ncbi:hypothetical protein P691DRAFT_772947 [Macrolepiota fuliginosa MF-IS2]|uniref:Uncharacterized protein n=1 Tax=Macrolepiota fuliginosa MF-IS2 TaxID=1400762 RepID=A0A9P6C794_9AGAR|nr:hypothetical protein P691DRAFT_772947 [Macrolepiota fuliginosa MF-IS2]
MLPASSELPWLLGNGDTVGSKDSAQRKNLLGGKQPLRVGRVSTPEVTKLEEVIELTDSDSDHSLPRANCPVMKPTPVVSTSPTRSPSSTVPRRRGLSFSQFAFQSTSTRSTSRSVSAVATQTRSLSSSSSAEKTKTSRDRRKTHLGEINISTSAMSRLEKCVCCDARWTTRKTVSQKLSHIRTCSRKKSYSSETVSILVRKELKITVESRTEKTETISNTHLEDVVQDSLPRKKRRQERGGSTVQEYSGAKRENILKRARAILGSPLNLDENRSGVLDFPVSTQAVRPFEFRTTDIEPSSPTQSFLPSKLQQAITSGLSHPRQLLRGRGLSLSSGSLDSIQLVDSINSTSEYSPPILMSRSPLRASRLALVNENITQQMSTMSIKVKGRNSTSGSSALAADKPPRRRNRRTPSQTKIPTKEEKGLLKQRLAAAADEQWQKEFRIKIMQDFDLYNRILRYETQPIHIDVFQLLAPRIGARGQHRDKLVSFLDQQAINFYGYGQRWCRSTYSRLSSSRRTKTV